MTCNYILLTSLLVPSLLLYAFGCLWIHYPTAQILNSMNENQSTSLDENPSQD